MSIQHKNVPIGFLRERNEFFWVAKMVLRRAIFFRFLNYNDSLLPAMIQSNHLFLQGFRADSVKFVFVSRTILFLNLRRAGYQRVWNFWQVLSYQLIQIVCPVNPSLCILFSFDLIKPVSKNASIEPKYDIIYRQASDFLSFLKYSGISSNSVKIAKKNWWEASRFTQVKPSRHFLN